MARVTLGLLLPNPNRYALRLDLNLTPNHDPNPSPTSQNKFCFSPILVFSSVSGPKALKRVYVFCLIQLQ